MYQVKVCYGDSKNKTNKKLKTSSLLLDIQSLLILLQKC